MTEFSYEVSPELVRTATRRWFQHALRHVPFLTLAMMAGCGYLLAIGWTAIAAGLLITLLLVEAVAGLLYVRTSRMASGVFARLPDRTVHYQITGEGLERRSALGRMLFRWDTIRKVVRYPEVWLLYIGRAPYWVPAAPLAGEAGAQILEHARQAGAKIL